MPSSKEKVEASFKKIQGQLKKAPKKLRAQGRQISQQISDQINERIGNQFAAQFSTQLHAVLSSKVTEQAQEVVKTAARTAQATAHIAAETAKHGIDQVLLNLEHRGLNVKDSQDLAVKVGRRVLERAEAIRAQIAANPLSPSWIKDVSLKPLETADLERDVASPTGTVPMAAEPAPIAAAALSAEPSEAPAEAITGADDTEDAAEVKKPRRASRSKASSSGTSARTK